jgi:cytolysin (calcineurin-like family phosphatase)
LREGQITQNEYAPFLGGAKETVANAVCTNLLQFNSALSPIICLTSSSVSLFLFAKYTNYTFAAYGQVFAFAASTVQRRGSGEAQRPSRQEPLLPFIQGPKRCFGGNKSSFELGVQLDCNVRHSRRIKVPLS